MRLEAKVSDNRGTAAMQLAEELGLTQSQLIDEALTLFLKAVLEVRRGRRLVTLDPDSSAPATLLATPTLAALEWGHNPEKLGMPVEALEKLKTHAEAPQLQALWKVSSAAGNELKTSTRVIHELLQKLWL